MKGIFCAVFKLIKDRFNLYDDKADESQIRLVQNCLQEHILISMIVDGCNEKPIPTCKEPIVRIGNKQ